MKSVWNFKSSCLASYFGGDVESFGRVRESPLKTVTVSVYFEE